MKILAMCYFVSNDLTRKEMKDTFGVTYEGRDFEASDFLNGFSFPRTAVVLDESPALAQPAVWGLIPAWAKDRTIQKSTLNARLETLTQKPSFRDAVHNRCLMLVRGFYEWKWLDSAGKRKEKHYLQLDNGGRPFALGALYSSWQDPETHKELLTFSVVTSDANELMAGIHNTKDRMPLVLTPEASRSWLADHPLERFGFPAYDPPLLAENLDGGTGQLSLFD